MRDVYVVGVYTSKFGRCQVQSIKDLTRQSAEGVLRDASLDKRQLQSAWFSNSAWGLSSYQHCIRGQVALRSAGIDAIPITNVENACASGSTAFHGAWKDVASGAFDVSLALGAEKVYQANKYAMFASFIAGTDTEALKHEVRRLRSLPASDAAASVRAAKSPKAKPQSFSQRLHDVRDQLATGVQLGETLGYDTLRALVTTAARSRQGGERSPFMDIYALKAREHMQRYGSTARQLAVIASKNHWHSSLNPCAQYTFEVSVDAVLADRVVSAPLTRAMCAPIGDGTAAAILMSEEATRRFGLMARAVRVRASVLGSGRARGPEEPDIGERLAQLAYERSAVAPSDLHCVELHDATAFGELHQSEALGLFPRGEGGLHAERGETTLGGRLPVNPSGGLLSRGHPIGASGLAQIHELVTQLRGEAGPRQVQGARLALAENGGGALGEEEAAMCIHIFERT